MDKDLQQKQSKIIKIALVGPESTGKTTLSQALATEYQTIWVEEYAREYLQNKWDNVQKTCQPEDLLPIAKGQIKLENEALAKANTFLFCDTNLLVTYIYSKIYYKSVEDWLKKCTKEHEYDLTFLTDIDVPWTKDDLREAPDNRFEHLKTFEKYLNKFNIPYLKISGTLEERIFLVKAYLKEFLISKELNFERLDFTLLKKHEISFSNIKNHLEKIKQGTNSVKLNRIASIGDGILNFNENEINHYANLFEKNKEDLSMSKFVPASGAATRMFQFLQEFLNDFDYKKETLNNYINRKKAKNLNLFFLTLNKFPFYESLMREVRNKISDYDQLDKNRRAYIIIDFLISPKGLNFAALPKAVIPFHQVDKCVYTPVDQHLQDFLNLVPDEGSNQIHFTISENHLHLLNAVVHKFLNEKIVNIKISHSFQKKNTNTIAFSKDFKPLKVNGQFIIRPSGHGALLENLNEIEADIIYIQNIDNVTLHNKKEIIDIKKALTGYLIDTQNKLFEKQFEFENEIFSEDLALKLKDFLIQTFKTDFDDLFDGLKIEFKKNVLQKLLFKPIRVCGMVRNEGEPGGGPFWVENDKGYLILQIIESAQINLKDDKQAKIFHESTHFNPVDLVCGVKDFCGKKYNLLNFIDENTGFVVEKSSNGQEFLAYELPGLWNGSMAKWHTLFVDVPLFTFNPVKTVVDLLKPNHQEHAFEI